MTLQTNLVLFGDGNDLFQLANFALHAVDAFHHDEDFGPRVVVQRLAVDDSFAQNGLQVLRVCKRNRYVIRTLIYYTVCSLREVVCMEIELVSYVTPS